MHHVNRSIVQLFLASIIGITLTGCNPSPGAKISAAGSTNTYQAIDGYIVNGMVFCDGLRYGTTLAGGRFTCPKDSALIRVRGGSDVGFNDSTVAGGTPFIGELTGPASSQYITPLSTLAVKMSSDAGKFNSLAYAQAESTLTQALGIEEYSLSLNPVNHFPLLKANAQVHQLISQFATTADEYTIVATELAEVIGQGTPLDLINDTNTIVSAINQQLTTSTPELAITASEEVALSNALSAKNEAIEASGTLAELESVVTDANSDAPNAFLINKDSPLVAYDTNSGALSLYSLTELQDANLYFGHHRARFDADWHERVYISADALTIKQSLSGTTVDVALEFKSLSDKRQLSATLSGVTLSMHKSVTNVINIELPSGSVINARAVDAQGIETSVTVVATNNHISNNADGGFSFDLSDVNRKIRNASGHSVLYEQGDYQMTVVISGIRFSVADDTGEYHAPLYSISSGMETVTGYGLRGFVSRVGY